MTVHSNEELQSLAEPARLAEAVERLAEQAEKQTEVLQIIADHLTGVCNLIDTLDTNLGHHLAAIAHELE